MTRLSCPRCLLRIGCFYLVALTVAYNPSSTRRNWITQQTSFATISFGISLPARASVPDNQLLQQIQDAQSTLGTLLNNWERATVDCNYADVPRELLEAKNKEILLEKASTFALFDKSVSVESCKTSNRLVRDYLGVTGKGPLVGVDKLLRRGMELVEDIDDLDKYVAEMELFSQNMSRADSLSYMARKDFDAVNNYAKDERRAASNSNLEEARRSIVEAKSNLDQLVCILMQ